MEDRYLVEGILRDVSRGRDVLVLARDDCALAPLVRAVERAGGDDAWARAVRTPGQQALTHRSGGRLWAKALHARGHRGVSAHVAVVLDYSSMGLAERREVLINVPPALAARDGDLMLR